MNKKIMFLVAMVVLVIGLVACGKKEEEVKPVQSGETVVVVSGESESRPVAKETNPYVANIPNEILDFYKEKVEAIEEANKKENEALLKENPDLNLDELSTLKYELVFFDDNNIPELVVDKPGYRVALYTYDAGEVIYAMKDDSADGDEGGWGYGAGGNHGYEYIPRENILRNYNADLAGLIMNVNYCELDPATHQLKNKYEKALAEYHFNDKNGNGEADEDETEEYIEEARYYYGDKEITSGDWASYMVEGIFEPLQGTKSASDMLLILDGLINEK